ncbi:MAG: hypothetical protein AAF717_00145 [Bacteroidota bacterium]
MPILTNNDKVGLTKEELIPEFYASWENLRKQIQRDTQKGYGLKKLNVGGNGRKVLIDFDSIPAEFQQQLEDPRKAAHILERYYRRDLNAAKFYAEYIDGCGNHLLIHAQQRYTINASLMNALKELEEHRIQERKSKGGSIRGVLNTLAQDAESFKEVMQRKYGYQHNIPTSKRFKNAYRDYKKVGYVTLIKDAKGVSRNNARKVTDDTIDLLNNMFAGQRHKPNPTEIYVQYNAFIKGSLEVINDTTGEIYDPAKFNALSERSIRHYLNKWENRIGTHAKRNGDRQKLITLYSPYHSWTPPTLAGSIISVDDRQPPFEYDKGKRMWFYNGIDLASEAYTVFVYGKTKEGIILEFYRQMVRNYHEWGFELPAELEGELSLNASYLKTFLEEGCMFQHVNIYPNSARSKRIEAYFKPLRYNIEKEREGWLARPFAKSESNQISNVQKMTVPYDRLVRESLRDLATWNNMEHSKHKGITRWEYFCENQNPNLPTTNYSAILPHLGYKTETSCNTGIVRMNKRLWLLAENGRIQTGERLIHFLKQVEGQQLEVYWLDGNNGKIVKALAFQNGRHICDLLPKPTPNKAKIERTAEDEAQMHLMAQYKRTVDAYMQSRHKELDAVTVFDYRQKTLNNKFIIPGLDEAEFISKDYESADKTIPEDPGNNDDDDEIDFYINNPANSL